MPLGSPWSELEGSKPLISIVEVLILRTPMLSCTRAMMLLPDGGGREEEVTGEFRVVSWVTRDVCNRIRRIACSERSLEEQKRE